MVNLRDLCWNTETEMLAADKSSPKPLRKAFVRQYHMLIRTFAEAQKGRVFTKASDVIAWAEECDPDLDLPKVMARLERIKGELSAFHSDWPVDDIRVCVDALGDVDKKALKASRSAVVSNVVPIAPGDAASRAHHLRRSHKSGTTCRSARRLNRYLPRLSDRV